MRSMRTPPSSATRSAERVLTVLGLVLLLERVWVPVVAAADPVSGRAVALDPAFGRAVALDPARGDCGICHVLPAGNPREQGTVGPPLRGLASRYRADELERLIADPRRRNPDTVMPAYGATDGLRRVPAELVGRPILTEDEIAAVVAWLLAATP